MYTYKIKSIINIVDGDTVDVEIDLGFSVRIVHRIRLMGVDAPEMRTKDFGEKQKGISSREWLVKILSGEKDLKIQTFKEEKYGRMLGVIYVRSKDTGEYFSLNEKMVEDGIASIFP